MTAPAPQPRPPDDTIEGAPQPPRPVEHVVPVVATDPGEGLVQGARRRCRRDGLVIVVGRPARPLGITGNRVGGHESGVAPARFDGPRADPPQRQFDRGTEFDRLVRHEIVDRVVGHHGFLEQRSDQRAGDRERQRGQEPDPPRRQALQDERQRDHHPTWEPIQFRDDLHQVLARHDVGSADLEHAVDLLGVVEHPDQIEQHVPDRDRLASGTKPFRGRHHRELVGEVSNHLERDRSGADDHSCPQLGDGCRAFGEDPPDSLATDELGRAAMRASHVAQVHDPLDAGGLGGVSEVGCPASVVAFEVGEGSLRVDEVVRR